MGSVSSTPSSGNNNGLTDLMQTLANENSPLLSTLSSPNIQQALEAAPAGDIVQISEQAMQLQATDALFGITSPQTTPMDSLFSALATTGANSSASAGGSGGQSGSLAELFGSPPANTPTSPFNVLA